MCKIAINKFEGEEICPMGFGSASDDDIKKAIYGGLLMSLASSLFYLLKGRMTGMSGLLPSIYKSDINNYWKIAMLASIVLTSGIISLGAIDGIKLDIKASDYTSNLSFIGFGVAGYLVGLGSYL